MRPLYWDQDPESSFKEVKSDNPLVTNVWFTGTAGGMTTCIHLVSGEIKPGRHPDNDNVKRFNMAISRDQVESLDIPEAIEWINNLKPDVDGAE